MLLPLDFPLIHLLIFQVHQLLSFTVYTSHDGTSFHSLLKNKNRNSVFTTGSQKFVRFASYDSNSPMYRKRATFISLLHRIHTFSSCSSMRTLSVWQYSREFRLLGYSSRFIKDCLAYMSEKQHDYTWSQPL